MISVPPASMSTDSHRHYIGLKRANSYFRSISVEDNKEQYREGYHNNDIRLIVTQKFLQRSRCLQTKNTYIYWWLLYRNVPLHHQNQLISSL